MERRQVACRKCGAPVFFAKSEKGVSNIFDWDEDPEKGNMRLDARGVAHYVGPIGEGPRYHSHFWTCPFAKEFRQPAQPRLL